jgi:uncharacterized protein
MPTEMTAAMHRATALTHALRWPLILGLLIVCPGTMAAAPALRASELSGLTQILHGTNQFWSQQFAALGGQYRDPELMLFADGLKGVCGLPGIQTGPFYCPMNQVVYIDGDFIARAEQHAGAASGLMRSYLIGHEVAHHVQALIGTTGLVEQARSRSSPAVARLTLTKMELQAECYDGLWLRWAAQHRFGPSASAMPAVIGAVSMVSDHARARLSAERQLTDPLTLGSDDQRLYWLKRGLDSGHFADCDTFNVNGSGTA